MGNSSWNLWLNVFSSSVIFKGPPASAREYDVFWALKRCTQSLSHKWKTESRTCKAVQVTDKVTCTPLCTWVRVKWAEKNEITMPRKKNIFGVSEFKYFLTSYEVQPFVYFQLLKHIWFCPNKGEKEQSIKAVMQNHSNRVIPGFYTHWGSEIFIVQKRTWGRTTTFATWEQHWNRMANGQLPLRKNKFLEQMLFWGTNTKEDSSSGVH